MPPVGLPELEAVVGADDDGVPAESGVLPKVRRDADAPLGVEVRFVCSPDEEVDEGLDRTVRPRSLPDLGVDALPLTCREHREAFVHPTGHDRSFFEAGSKLCGDRQPTLLVQRVGEFAGKVRFQLP